MEFEGDAPIKGTCQTMCPASELRLREREGLLHRFEIYTDQGAGVRRFANKMDKFGKREKPKGDPGKAVKVFSRPAAGRVQPSPGDVRPAPVLLSTVVYLFDSVVPVDRGNWAQVYDFVFDRLRAVRQDAVLQALGGSELIPLLQCAVRFHVYAGYRLSEATLDVFDPVINNQHLLECLKQVIRLYQCTPGPHGDQTLFEALYLLHNLGSEESILHALALPSSVRESSLVQSALDLSLAYLQGNFVRFFRKALNLPSVLCLCSAHRHFSSMRLHAMQVMCVAYSSKTSQYPLANLGQLLRLSRGHLGELLEACHLLQEGDKVTAQHVRFLKTKWAAPAKVPVCKQPEIDAKLRAQDVRTLILGQLHSAS